MTTELQKRKNIYELDLHERVSIGDNFDFVIRVASGWIYSIDRDKVFVPFDNHFMDEDLIDEEDQRNE